MTTKWITKKEKPKSWITKKEKPTKWITKKPTTKSTLTGTDTTRGGGPDEGNVGYNKEMISRHQKYRKQKPEWIKRKKKPEGMLKPYRAKHGLGSIVKGAKKIISKIKPKPVPKKVTDKPAGWSPKGSYTKSDDKKITSMLKKLGDEIKAPPLPPQLKKTLKKAQKAFPHKKASGGRIGLKHGGSVGAAKRGHGAEIK